MMMRRLCTLAAALALGLAPVAVAQTVGPGGGGGLKTVPGGSSGNVQINTSGSFAGSAQVIFDGSGNLLDVNEVTTNPNAKSDNTDHVALHIRDNTDGTTTNVGFTDEYALELEEFANSGAPANYGSGTNAKKTYSLLNMQMTAVNSGQRIGENDTLTCYGMSDCGAYSAQVTYANGPINGDEGENLTMINHVQQQGSLTLTTISSVPAQTTCNTTLTQNVTASQNAQAVTVASVSGCNVNDWVILNTGAATGSPNQAAMLLTAVGGGTLTGVFPINMTSGEAVTPAEVIIVASANALGQDRVLVDHTQATYTTGTVASISGGGFTGSGTTWTNGMVGGSALNPGCIMLAADTYQSAPFNGSNAQGPLNSWYEISSVTGNTSLGIYRTSTAGDAAYHGKGPGSGSYTIAPCARIMQIVGSKLILNTNSFTWSASDSVEQVITPYPDSSGYTVWMTAYTNGGSYRSGFYLNNTGARQFSDGIVITSNMPTGSDVDARAWNTGIEIDNAGTAILGAQSSDNGIIFDHLTGYGAEFFGDNGSGGNASGNGLTAQQFDTGLFIGKETSNVLKFSDSTQTHSVVLSEPASFASNRTWTAPDTSGTLGVILTTTVGGLPAGYAGQIAFVTDANAACTAGTTPTGGGSTKCFVGFNGAAWKEFGI